MEVEDDLEKISEALNYQKRTKRTNNLQSSAVSSKVEEIKEQLSKDHEESLKSSIEKVKDDLAKLVDKYLTLLC